MNATRKKWFAAVVITRSHSTSPTYRPLFEETTLLINATSSEDARGFALEWASDSAAVFTNEAGEEVEWSLDRVLDIKEMNESPGHLTEVYSRHFRDMAAYRRFEPLLEGDLD